MSWRPLSVFLTADENFTQISEKRYNLLIGKPYGGEIIDDDDRPGHRFERRDCNRRRIRLHGPVLKIDQGAVTLSLHLSVSGPETDSNRRDCRRRVRWPRAR